MQDIPKYNDLYNSILQNYAAGFNDSVENLDVSIKVEANVLAGILYPIYLRNAYLQESIYPDLKDETELLRYGFHTLSRYPIPATQGKYKCVTTGINGQTITESTTYIANDETDAVGSIYIVDEDYVVSGGVVNPIIRSLEAGTAYALQIGDTLTAVQPQATENVITVTEIIENPIDAEDLESYRADILERMRVINTSDSPAALRLWCSYIGEIEQTYPYLDTPGEVKVYVESTAAATSTNIIENPNDVVGVPTQATLDKVYKEPSGTTPESGALLFDETTLEGRKSIGILNIQALPVVPVEFNVVVNGLSDVSYLTSIKSAIESLFYTKRPFIAGADSINNQNDIISKDSIVSEIISLLAGTGVTYTIVYLYKGITNIDNYRLDNGEIPFINNVTTV